MVTISLKLKKIIIQRKANNLGKLGIGGDFIAKFDKYKKIVYNREVLPKEVRNLYEKRRESFIFDN